ncbi:EAL domain-containing protein [Geovibrio thiophilus]|uniref:EAL domain-containing protein n=1 Tax=Geovibrio thiophilus TaxID=139438 RepID=A0A3R5XY43_9BACT|nr:EAL domain-containing protein [Geovibrio thiophilus]QAR33601.1 EAL domain-containing protein [Geovibrio thiophilus]
MSDRIFVGRQPILDINGNIYAYEILFRNAEKNVAEIDDNLSATSSVLLHLLQNFGIETLLGSKKGFINIDESVIDEDIIALLPADKTVLEILETTKVTDDLVNKIKGYGKQNYSFALDDFIFTESHAETFRPLFGDVSFIKVDIRSVSKMQIIKNMDSLKAMNVRLLAEKVENRDEFEFCKKLGFEYFQGYYFAKPLVVSAKKGIDPAVAGVISLINILRDEDSTMEFIAREMKNYPAINLNLLKFINSSSFFLRADITSIKHAAALLGRNNLSKWLTLLLYASKGSMDPCENPLMQTAHERASTMEKIADKSCRDLREKAFLTGLMSLLDVILESPFEAFLDQFNVSTDIKEAVLGSENRLGKLLKLAIMLERNEIDEAMTLLREFNLTLADAAEVRMESFVTKDKGLLG